MFHSARIKLTAWYLLIIMVVSIAFSVAVYKILTFELDRVERAQRLRIELRNPNPQYIFPPTNLQDDLLHPFRLDPDIIEETKTRLKIILFLINLGILGSSAVAGYFLAGKTLRPIKEMVDEQNRFITDASHELRTPLTALKAEIEVNLRNKKLTLEDAKKILASNLEETNNLQILSDDLIKLTQYQQNDNGMLIAKISLSDVVNEAVKKVTRFAKDKNITIINEVDKITIEGDKQSLTESLVIFLDNAIKYSPAKTEVNLSSHKTDGYVLITITDQGTGINKADIPHLFDRFYRADKSRTKTATPGYGLGLAIAKQIIDRHHGTIIVDSSLNKGSTFTIKLPLKHLE